MKKELKEDEYQRLKGLLGAFRKNPNDLTDKEKQILQVTFGHSPDLSEAYHLRNEMTAIFEQSLSQEEALGLLEQWKQRVQSSGLKCFDAFLKTLDTFQIPIVNYFNQRANSGFVEGLNNKIKVIKRRCYGIFNIQHLPQRILLDTLGAERLIKN